MKWLITGGCGFIGRNLNRALFEEGRHYIRIVDNLNVGTREELASAVDFVESDSRSEEFSLLDSCPVELIVGDIRDKNLALRVSQGFDVVVHLAANTGVAPSVKDPRADCEVNVLGTLNYLEAARQNNISRFVFASSGAPVGEAEPPIHEEMAPHPVSPYGASKLAGEGYCSAYFRTFGVETVCLRFGNVYGPLSSNKDSVVAKFIKQALRGLPLEIYGDGTQTRDFIFVEDIVQAIKLAAHSQKAAGEVLQIATSAETTVNGLLERLISILEDCGVSGIRVVHGQKRKGDVMRNYSDTGKAKKLLGWESQYSLEKGLQKTVEWFLT